MDPGTWTGTETESEIDEDFIGAIPSSLRSSQLSGSHVLNTASGATRGAKSLGKFNPKVQAF